MQPASDTAMPTKERFKKRTSKKRKARPKVDTLGISLEAQRLRHLLFIGKKPAWAAKATGFGLEYAQRILSELEAVGCGPKSEGPFTVTQGSVVLGLKLRRTRTLCEEGRIGKKHGERLYLITREDLERFGAKERRSGHPGVIARAEERGENGDGHSKNGVAG